VLVICSMIVMIITGAMIEIVKMSRAASLLMELQNKGDAHMLSVAGLYIDTLNEVSWINKQLRRLMVFCLPLIAFPELYYLIEIAEKAAKGLEKYQDFLLLKLKIYAPLLDVKLRKENGLGLLPNYHYVKHRRQPPVYILFFRLPGLIEFHKNIFNSACVKHEGIITGSIACVKYREFEEKPLQREWFATTDEEWDVNTGNAY
ncbi:MAG: hypothetical protein JXA66_00190, partial [Oligoflexia bacterium]|nr:hypothetical protein [Oligoflexia bacterium]